MRLQLEILLLHPAARWGEDASLLVVAAVVGFQIPPIFCISHLPSSALKKNPQFFLGFSDHAHCTFDLNR
jgi:hypothetical protein